MFKKEICVLKRKLNLIWLKRRLPVWNTVSKVHRTGWRRDNRNGKVSEPDEPDEPEEQFLIVGEAVHGVGVMTNYIRQQNQEFVVTNEEFKTLLSIKEKKYFYIQLMRSDKTP